MRHISALYMLSAQKMNHSSDSDDIIDYDDAFKGKMETCSNAEINSYIGVSGHFPTARKVKLCDRLHLLNVFS